MKIGEVWKRQTSVEKALFRLGAHPMSVGSGKVRIIGITEKMVQAEKLNGGEYDEQINMSRESFVQLYEKVYDYKETV